MADIIRHAGAVWEGDLHHGDGTISTHSGALVDQPYSFSTRFENEPGTNPEELIAAAHAACYSMALVGTLASEGYRPERIRTQAAITLVPRQGGGYRITKAHLEVRVRVPDIDEDTFQQIAAKADGGCPVSNLLRCGLQIDREAELD
jgi:osmotically inducible protein OsmC